MVPRLGWVALAWLVVACGGRAYDTKTRQSATAGAAAGGEAQGGVGVSVSHAGASGGGAGAMSAAGSSPTPILNDFDNEQSDEPGRPEAPVPGAFFWGVGSSYHIGYWFLHALTQSDAAPVPIEPPRDGSTEARRASGSGLDSGAVLWAQLDHPFGRAVDLSPFTGITFWARFEGTDPTLIVSLNDGANGGGQLEGRDALPSVVVPLSEEWQQITLGFDDFEKADISKVGSIEFFVGKGGGRFDVWIDDLTLMCPAPCH